MRPLDPAAEAQELLAGLIKLNTVNPPGNERPAQEYLAAHLSAAGFECELLGAEPGRPNLVARLGGAGDVRDGPTLCCLGHVDTVLADPAEWSHDPWSADVDDGCMWGRGALDMKSQVAAEVAAAASLARAGWRPARGELLIVTLVDEETGGVLGAEWLTQTHPERVRCDMLVNEGAGCVFEYGGARHYGVCCAEKGVFRFTVTTSGVAGHASMPSMGENALLRMAPLLQRLGARQPSYELTDVPRAFLSAIGEDPDDPVGSVARLRSVDRRLATMFEPLLGVTFAPTRINASEKINVIPSRAVLRVDCRVPPGLGEAEVRQAIEEVLGSAEGSGMSEAGSATGGLPSAHGARGVGPGGEGSHGADWHGEGSHGADWHGEGSHGAGSRSGSREPSADDSRPVYAIEFTERIPGNSSPMQSPLMDAISDWVSTHDPGAHTAPTILPGFTDSRHFRAAFPECVAYGFFPQRHQSLLETAPLIHSANERIDLRDLAFAAEFYRDLALSILG